MKVYDKYWSMTTADECTWLGVYQECRYLHWTQTGWAGHYCHVTWPDTDMTRQQSEGGGQTSWRGSLAVKLSNTEVNKQVTLVYSYDQAKWAPLTGEHVILALGPMFGQVTQTRHCWSSEVIHVKQGAKLSNIWGLLWQIHDIAVSLYLLYRYSCYYI